MTGEITTAQKGSFAPIPGNSLGLAIVKSIAEGHAGNVTVESEPGKGSRFTWSLPLVQTEESIRVGIERNMQ